MGWPLRKSQTQTKRMCAKQTDRRWTWLTRCSVGLILRFLVFPSLITSWSFIFSLCHLSHRDTAQSHFVVSSFYFRLQHSINASFQYFYSLQTFLLPLCIAAFPSVCFLSASRLFVNLKLKQPAFAPPCPWLTLAAVSPVGPASWLPRGPRSA